MNKIGEFSNKPDTSKKLISEQKYKSIENIQIKEYRKKRIQRKQKKKIKGTE